MIKLCLLVSLVRLAVQYDPLGERPLFLAGFYTAGAWFFNLMMPLDRPYWPLWLVAGLLLAWLYFRLLALLEDAGLLWWLVMLAGLPLIVL